MEEAIKAYQDGATLAQVGEILGCSVPTAAVRLRKAGVEIRKRGRPRSDGETGKHKGLKIPREKSLAGSSPAPSTITVAEVIKPEELPPPVVDMQKGTVYTNCPKHGHYIGGNCTNCGYRDDEGHKMLHEEYTKELINKVQTRGENVSDG